MKANFIIALALFSLTVVSSCSFNKQVQPNTERSSIQDSLDFNHKVEVKSAKKLRINNFVDHKEVYVINPFASDTIATYVLALKQTVLDSNTESRGLVIRVPIQSIVCLSSTHVGALELLNLRDKILGTTNITHYWDEEVNSLISAGKIKEVGKGLNVDVELITSLMPDVVVKNDHSKNIKEKELEAVGIHTVFYNDWREGDLLSRAEWIKMMGLLFCKNIESDSIFGEIVKRYDTVKELAASAKVSPQVLIAQDIKGTWYVPGGESYVPAMLKDANAYTKTIEGVSTSMPCSFEKIYENHRNIPYWISLKGGTVASLDEFGSMSEHYKEFEAFRSGNVYINNKRVKPQGGNDFWETGAYKPDVILKDLVKILHPELLPDYETYYWRKLK